MTDDIKLGRIGHYSYQQVCQHARVVFVLPDAFDSEVGDKLPTKVTIAGEDHDGNHFSRRGVPVGVFSGPEAEFHLNMECPFGK